MILFLLVYLTDTNRAIFAALNALSPVTGDFLWANVTILGDTLVALVLCLLLWRAKPEVLWALVFALVLGTLWARGLKFLVDVERPVAALGETVHVIGKAYRTHAFPSGHATTAFTVAGLFALGFRTWPWISGALLLATLVGISRAVVGVHWPLDILAGAFGGWLCAALALHLGKNTLQFGMQAWVQWTLAALLAIGAVALVYPYSTDYADAIWLQRLLGLGCLVGAGARLNRDLRRRSGL
ncbi:MAG: phosphatase PAP2 family protein [Betaproteobacteria bacterium]